ncbi:hypothetical protein JCM1841_000644 [Sporobolomyces salmonicolor]
MAEGHQAALEGIGLRRSGADHGTYVRHKGGKIAIIPTHVDDGLVVVGDDLDGILNALSNNLEKKFKCVDNGLFLSMVLKRSEGGSVSVSQEHYARSVLAQFFPEGLSFFKTLLDSASSSCIPASEEE